MRPIFVAPNGSSFGGECSTERRNAASGVAIATVSRSTISPMSVWAMNRSTICSRSAPIATITSTKPSRNANYDCPKCRRNWHGRNPWNRIAAMPLAVGKSAPIAPLAAVGIAAFANAKRVGSAKGTEVRTPLAQDGLRPSTLNGMWHALHDSLLNPCSADLRHGPPYRHVIVLNGPHHEVCLRDLWDVELAAQNYRLRAMRNTGLVQRQSPSYGGTWDRPQP